MFSYFCNYFSMLETLEKWWDMSVARMAWIILFWIWFVCLCDRIRGNWFGNCSFPNWESPGMSWPNAFSLSMTCRYKWLPGRSWHWFGRGCLCLDAQYHVPQLKEAWRIHQISPMPQKFRHFSFEIDNAMFEARLRHGCYCDIDCQRYCLNCWEECIECCMIDAQAGFGRCKVVSIGFRLCRFKFFSSPDGSFHYLLWFRRCHVGPPGGFWAYEELSVYIRE